MKEPLNNVAEPIQLENSTEALVKWRSRLYDSVKPGSYRKVQKKKEERLKIKVLHGSLKHLRFIKEFNSTLTKELWMGRMQPTNYACFFNKHGLLINLLFCCFHQGENFYIFICLFILNNFNLFL